MPVCGRPGGGRGTNRLRSTRGRSFRFVSLRFDSIRSKGRETRRVSRRRRVAVPKPIEQDPVREGHADGPERDADDRVEAIGLVARRRAGDGVVGSEVVLGPEAVAVVRLVVEVVADEGLEDDRRHGWDDEVPAMGRSSRGILSERRGPPSETPATETSSLGVGTRRRRASRGRRRRSRSAWPSGRPVAAAARARARRCRPRRGRRRSRGTRRPRAPRASPRRRRRRRRRARGARWWTRRGSCRRSGCPSRKSRTGGAASRGRS